MRFRSLRFICSIVALIFLAVVFTGCAQRMQSVKEDGMTDAGAMAALQAIKVSEDGSLVTISANKPLTYTFYKVGSPLKVVLDISQAEPGGITAPLEPATGNVKRVDVSRQGFGPNVLSRVEIYLVNDSEYTVTSDPEDKGKLLVTFAKTASLQPEPTIATGLVTPASAETANGHKPAMTEPVAVENQPKAEEIPVKAEVQLAPPAVKA